MAMNPRLLRPLATGFNPASIAGIVHWWDANDASTLTLASGFVSEWRSKAGTLTAATQSVANNRPTTTTVNGRTALLFDGLSDGLDFTGTSRTDETWIIAVAQTANQANASFLSDSGNGHGFISARGSVRIFDSSWGGYVDGTNRLRAQYSSNAATPLGPAVLSVVRSTAGGGFVFIDGTQRSGVVGGFSSMSAPGATALSRIGYINSTTYQLQGWIGELLCWNRPLSAAERLRVERYLGKKWGITVA